MSSEADVERMLVLWGALDSLTLDGLRVLKAVVEKEIDERESGSLGLNIEAVL